MLFSRHKTEMVTPDAALPGRASRPFAVPERHFVLDTPLEGPYPDGLETAYFALGCFWGAERLFWELAGRRHDRGRLPGRVHPEPDLRGGLLGRDRPRRGRAGRLRPGEGVATTTCSRSSGRRTTRPRACARATTSARSTARRSTSRRTRSSGGGRGSRRLPAGAAPPPGTARSRPRSPTRGPFYYAEDYHQQYLAKNPNGYCGIGGTGRRCPVGVAQVPDAANEK